MSSILIRFPDGSREFRYPGRQLEEGEVVWHDGVPYRVVSLGDDPGGHETAVVEPVSDSLIDKLQSEEGALHLIATE